jgi:hypothetical protein
VVVANTVFWLKDVDPRFREGEDSNFNDIPTLVEHKQRLLEQGKEYTEKEKAEFFIGKCFSPLLIAYKYCCLIKHPSSTL